MKIKIYTNDEKVLNQVCKTYSIEPDYLRNGSNREVFGYGYCSEGRYLRVFCEDSAVDRSDSYVNITSDFIKQDFKL